MEQVEGDEEEEKETKPDPLHQLILHFSRTALTEKRLERQWNSRLWYKNWATLVSFCILCKFFMNSYVIYLVAVTVNLIQIISIWHMQILWQRWVNVAYWFEVVSRKCWWFFCDYFFLPLDTFRVAILVRKKKGERKWWKMLRMRCPLRCDSQNW